MPMARDDSAIKIVKRQVQPKHLDPATLKVRVLQKDRVPMPPGMLS
jgi:hypothetical protein